MPQHEERGDDFASFLEKEMGVRVLTINTTRQSRENDYRSNRSISFRLCIPSDDRDKLCDVSLLPDGIIIREWVFKSAAQPDRNQFFNTTNDVNPASRDQHAPRDNTVFAKP